MQKDTRPELTRFPEVPRDVRLSLADRALQDTVEMPVITDEMLALYDEDHIIRGQE